MLTGSLPVSIPIRIPPSYGHLGQQINLLRETGFSCFHHLLSLLTEEVPPPQKKADRLSYFGHHF